MKKRTKNLKSKNQYYADKKNCSKGCGGIYFLGFIGSAIYYLQQSTGFWDGVLGILKALVWPAFLIYKLFGM